MRALVFLALAPLLARGSAAQTVPRPTLVVLITVDQLLPDYFTRWPGQLTGGLHRLHTRGVVFTAAHHDHAITETAPGHATLLSGRFPRSTGIVRNTEGVQDPQAPLVGSGDGPASPYRFRGSTLIDWMRIRDPRSRALSVSRKDRGAILPLGRAHQSAYWFTSEGRFTTSTYYADTLPTWVRRFNERRTVERLAGEAWTLLLPASAYPEPDSVHAESMGRDFTFPHRVPREPASAAAEVIYTPWMDQMTLDLALEGVRTLGLGRGPAPDLLAVSLSATDYIGHRYGPDSREIHDQVLRLDRMLGTFLDSLAVLRGRENVLVALSGDHGVARLPEVANPGRAASYYLPREPFVRWLTDAARRRGLDSAAFEFDDGVVYARGVPPGRTGNLERLLDDFVAFARTRPGVLRADRLRGLQADSARDRLARRWVHTFTPDLAVGAVVTPRPGHLWGLPARGFAQHGSVHDYDTHVPLIFYGEGLRAARYERPVRTVDLAPTLARLLRVTPLEPLDGVVLREVAP